MSKINKSRLFFVVLFFIAIILVNGCGKKAECEITADCGQKTCMTASCTDGQCQYEPIPNCCGNNKRESTENGKPGNECTCPEDYGKCEGRGQITSGSRTYDTEHLRYYCERNECVLGIPSHEKRPVTLLDERDYKFFIFETAVTYNEPFDVTKDTFNFRVALKDDNDDLALPIRLTKILLKDGEVLFGEDQLNLFLEEVGDSVEIKVPVVYRLEQLEESRALEYDIDYEYTRKVKGERLPNGTYSTDFELVRGSYENRFTTKIDFVKSSLGK